MGLRGGGALEEGAAGGGEGQEALGCLPVQVDVLERALLADHHMSARR